MNELSTQDLYNLLKLYKLKINNICCKDEIKNHNGGWSIINMDNAGNGGTHWVCFYKGNDNIYFDSFGVIAPTQIEDIIKPYTMSKKQLQDIRSNSCGWFCIFCIYWLQNRNNSLKDFNNFLAVFSDNTVINEMLLIKFIKAL